MKNDIFLSEAVLGFEEPSGTLHTKNSYDMTFLVGTLTIWFTSWNQQGLDTTLKVMSQMIVLVICCYFLSPLFRILYEWQRLSLDSMCCGIPPVDTTTSLLQGLVHYHTLREKLSTWSHRQCNHMWFMVIFNPVWQLSSLLKATAVLKADWTDTCLHI